MQRLAKDSEKGGSTGSAWLLVGGLRANTARALVAQHFYQKYSDTDCEHSTSASTPKF